MIFTFGLCLPVAVAAELLALILLMVLGGPLHGREIVALIGLHLFAAVVGAEALRARYAKDDAAGTAAWRLSLCLSLLLPGFGLLVTIVLVLRTPRAVPPSAAQAVSPMEERRRQGEAELAVEAQQGHADVDIEPIGDALKDADKAKRLGAVEALRMMRNKQAVAMLSRSLQNTVFEVRYQAVEALAGIGKRHSDRIALAAAAAEREGTPETYRALGEAYFEYANMEMEEPSIQQHLFRNAVVHLRQSLSPGEPADVEVLQKVGRALEMTGELERATQSYHLVLEQRPESFEALLGLARVQFLQGEFVALRETCRKGLELRQGDAQMRAVLKLWAEGLGADDAQSS